MNESRAVGVFDSGVGGLSVLREIHARLPGQALIYLADSAHVPYGEKSPEFIRERCRRIAAFLLEKGACALVLACNTATAAAIADLRAAYPQLPIVGMEPALKPAVQATRSGVVGVLATTGTLRSAKFAALLEQVGRDVKVVMQPCPGLVERIEAGELASAETRALLAALVAPLLAAGCDTLILGCTHYPFIRPLLEDMLPASVSLVDTGAAVARRLQGLLAERGLLAGEAGEAGVRFWSSGEPRRMSAVLPLLWGHAARVDFFAG
ncbi:glutamate racemase [Stutzerimonas kirkiae]|uniref:Glutamate racemase n=1 Tax=Stutzerimonas kirkiae TaxID=2211392 RepID=A0A4Q9QX45_9GAMM|nr:glutamate racemase [Stutzerimonas kirkiae]TBU87805.1 glutamate racemase [Stutzerimonas kirkiae]TBU98037.1 glutamate racemase [Stutzerimonas kirkiae]TBV06914.1 glutamate racemase [Stutzerimonas kirkiae]TBV16184.1 glutamate racemase [Stutzerimonas kirkiae]